LSAAGLFAQTNRPTVVVILTDNLGYCVIGACGGGVTWEGGNAAYRPPAAEGMGFLNFNMETQWTPSRSSLN